MKPEDAFASLSGIWNLGTQAAGNWFIPQDAGLSPRRGPLVGLNNAIFGSEAGRRAMSAVDFWNTLTGQTKPGQSPFSNVGPGPEVAEAMPALENLFKMAHLGHFLENRREPAK